MVLIPHMSTLHVFLLVVCSVFCHVVNAHRNVYGEDLQPCSSVGMALTGYTRSGYCVNRDDDVGSHHICINLNATTTKNENFCQVTGQPNWCASTDMPCHDGDANILSTTSFGNCPIQNWCVCQWAFATYVEKAGGCHQIQDINCHAIHEQAILSYQLHQRGHPSYQRALECLVKRCGLSDSVLSSTG